MNATALIAAIGDRRSFPAGETAGVSFATDDISTKIADHGPARGHRAHHATLFLGNGSEACFSITPEYRHRGTCRQAGADLRLGQRKSPQPDTLKQTARLVREVACRWGGPYVRKRSRRWCRACGTPQPSSPLPPALAGARLSTLTKPAVLYRPSPPPWAHSTQLWTSVRGLRSMLATSVGHSLIRAAKISALANPIGLLQDVGSAD